MNINVIGNYTLELTPEAFLTQTANIYLQCKTSDAPVIITLPRITSVGGVTTTWGFKIYVNDVDNNASVNNITLTPHPADKINGTISTPVVLNTNGVTGHLEVTGGNSWEFNNGSGGSSSISEVVVTLTAEQIKTGQSIPIDILPAQGSGKAIQCTSGSYQYVYNGEAFTSGTIFICNGVSAQLGCAIGAFLNGVDNVFSIFTPSGITIDNVGENSPLRVVIDADSEVGNGTLTVWVQYKIITLP